MLSLLKKFVKRLTAFSKFGYNKVRKCVLGIEHSFAIDELTRCDAKMLSLLKKFVKRLTAFIFCHAVCSTQAFPLLLQIGMQKSIPGRN